MYIYTRPWGPPSGGGKGHPDNCQAPIVFFLIFFLDIYCHLLNDLGDDKNERFKNNIFIKITIIKILS